MPRLVLASVMSMTHRADPQPPAPAVEVAISGNGDDALDDLEEEIGNIIAVQLAVARASLTLGTSFEEIGADIYDIAEMIVSVEEALGIEIRDEQVDGLVTIGDFIAHVRACRLSRQPSVAAGLQRP